MNYKKITLGTLAYFVSSFVIQGLLGFAFAGEYFESISIFRILQKVTLGAYGKFGFFAKNYFNFLQGYKVEVIFCKILIKIYC